MSPHLTGRLLLLLLIVTNDVSAYVELIGAGATAPASTYFSWMAAYRHCYWSCALFTFSLNWSYEYDCFSCSYR